MISNQISFYEWQEWHVFFITSSHGVNTVLSFLARVWPPADSLIVWHGGKVSSTGTPQDWSLGNYLPT